MTLNIILGVISSDFGDLLMFAISVLLTACGYFLNRTMKQLDSVQKVTIQLREDMALHKQQHKSDLELVNVQFSNQISRLSTAIENLNKN